MVRHQIVQLPVPTQVLQSNSMKQAREMNNSLCKHLRLSESFGICDDVCPQCPRIHEQGLYNALRKASAGASLGCEYVCSSLE